MSLEHPAIVASAPLEHLPAEVLLQILTQLADLHCLWNLLVASPFSYRVFNQYSNEIFWPSLFNSIIPPQTQEVIQCVVSLRAGAFRNTPFDELIRKIRDREAGIVLGQSSALGYNLPSMDSNAVPSLSVLRSVLAVASRIRALSQMCINHYLQRIRAAEADKRIELLSTYKAFGCPSWVEEQRVIRAFWRVQLVTELKLAAENSRVRSSTEDIESPGQMDIENFYDSGINNLKSAFHEVMTAMEYLEYFDTDGRKDGSALRSHSSPYHQTSENVAPSTVALPMDASTRRSALVLPADGLWIVDSMARGAHSPIKYAGFEPYRGMGFAIWDRARLAGMGLASPAGQGRVTGLGSYFSSWVKLLGTQDMAQAEKKMREAECRGGA
ncbi:hypothetical protein CCHL11_01004 [Colletotrichum chlorophyti]|uniref:F-box domain-containing protein n=1 Tax=Colletotrichum chlorophyti TaxID=708187 RepID=A0A1Q8S7F0_9PEZI|nr:hypothetical protein CCHL11_01004 [Colletotrichum chlorophyti]